MTRPAVPRSAIAAAAVLAIAVLLSGIDPHDRKVWFAENALVLFLAGWLALSARSFPLSPLSYALVLGFLLLHEIGAHFTYPRVPYDRAIADWTGVSVDRLLGFERNQWDRFVHAAFGLAFAWPLREVVRRIAGVRGFWSLALPVALVMALSLVYEFIEWGVAATLGLGPASAFLGAQGDPWDAHHDLLLASLGALATVAIGVGVHASRDPRGFAREWRESVRVKAPPAG